MDSKALTDKIIANQKIISINRETIILDHKAMEKRKTTLIVAIKQQMVMKTQTITVGINREQEHKIQILAILNLDLGNQEMGINKDLWITTHKHQLLNHNQRHNRQCRHLNLLNLH